MTSDDTLGGYLEAHDRPPAFTGPDGAAYSVGLFVAGEPDADGTYGAALVFVRWAAAGDHAVGHVETPYLVRAPSPIEATRALHDLTLHEVKGHLDQAVLANGSLADW